MERNFFIIHGAYGHNKENWFPWLENELTKKGYDVYNLNYPTPENQNFENWSKILDSHIDKITENTTFICHSISCAFLIKYCTLNNIKIDKAFFVSGFNNYYFKPDFDKINKSMFTNEVSIFKDYCQDITCIYSKNDPFITFEELKNFADSINAKHLVYENAGHFNEKFGYKKFDDLLKIIF